MPRNLNSLILVAFIICCPVSAILTAGTVPNQATGELTVTASSPKAACSLVKTDLNPKTYVAFLKNDKVVTYFDPSDPAPAGCGSAALPYPYEILSFDVTFWGG